MRRSKRKKTYKELPQVQKKLILMMGVGPNNENLPVTDMIQSLNMQTLPKTKTGVKVQNHLQFEMIENKCMVELALGFCTKLNHGNLMCSSFSSSAIKGFSPFLIPPFAKSPLNIQYGN